MGDITRQKQIVEWLANSSHIAVPVKSGNGFFVNRGTIIRLKSGVEVETVEWLETEGFKNGVSVGGYKVKHTMATSEFPERLFFFKDTGAVDAPF